MDSSTDEDSLKMFPSLPERMPMVFGKRRLGSATSQKSSRLSLGRCSWKSHDVKASNDMELRYELFQPVNDLHEDAVGIQAARECPEGRFDVRLQDLHSDGFKELTFKDNGLMQQQTDISTKLKEVVEMLAQANVCITEQNARLDKNMLRERYIFDRIREYDDALMKIRHTIEGIVQENSALVTRIDKLETSLSIARQQLRSQKKEHDRVHELVGYRQTGVRSRERGCKGPASSAAQTPSIRSVSSRDVMDDNEWWEVHVVFVLDCDDPNVSEIEGLAYLDLQRNRPSQRVKVSGHSHWKFTIAIEGRFESILANNRKWMPLAVHRTEETGDLVLQPLPTKYWNEGHWTFDFLTSNCVFPHQEPQPHESRSQGFLFLALQEGFLTIREIRNLGSQLQRKDFPKCNTPSSSATVSRKPSVETLGVCSARSYLERSVAGRSTPRSPLLTSTVASARHSPRLSPIQSRRGSISESVPGSPVSTWPQSIASASGRSTANRSVPRSPLSASPTVSAPFTPSQVSFADNIPKVPTPTPIIRLRSTGTPNTPPTLSSRPSKETIASSTKRTWPWDWPRSKKTKELTPGPARSGGVEGKRESRPSYVDKLGIQHLTVERRPLWGRRSKP